MPQTREHLAILDLLQIQGGVVALAKTDLVDDPEWLDLVETDLRDTLVGTVLESAPILRVSANNGEGIPELLETLGDILSEKPARLDLARPRMAVDRAFTLSGFGTIVTGTLIDGQFQVGEEVAILPKGYQGRIRGLQTHKKKEQIAVPGSRTAVNVSGIDVTQIKRGDVVCYPGDYQSTRRIDVHFRVLEDVSQPIRHNTEVKLFIGATEVIARLRLLGAELLKPGDEGWLQLELNLPVVAVRGDRFILRRPSPGETLGGGVILDSMPEGRHRRFDENVINRLAALVRGTPEDVLLQASLSLGIALGKDIIIRSTLDKVEAQNAFENLIAEDQILILNRESNVPIEESYVTSALYWKELSRKAESEVDAFRKRYPLRTGIPREALKSRLKVSAKVFSAVIKQWIEDGVFAETLVRSELPGVSPIPVIHIAGYAVTFSPDQQEQVDHLLSRFAEAPHTPPTIKESIAEVGQELFNAMIDKGFLVPLSVDVVFRTEDYYLFVENIRKMLETQGAISVAQVRDEFQTSRRYVLAILEHLDAIGVTIRAGDVRRLKQPQ
jgi:selenocysteine-specific elongation factor